MLVGVCVILIVCKMHFNFAFQKLLVGRRLRELGTLAARLDFPVVSWLRKEQCRAARVDDFVSALRQVHSDFSWPYPAVTVTSLRQMTATRPPTAPTVDSMLALAINKVEYGVNIHNV